MTLNNFLLQRESPSLPEPLPSGTSEGASSFHLSSGVMPGGVPHSSSRNHANLGSARLLLFWAVLPSHRSPQLESQLLENRYPGGPTHRCAACFHIIGDAPLGWIARHEILYSKGKCMYYFVCYCPVFSLRDSTMFHLHQECRSVAVSQSFWQRLGSCSDLCHSDGWEMVPG